MDSTCIGYDMRAEYYSRCRAIEDWNTRPAPPVGRCRDCFQYHSEGPGVGYCSLDDQGREETNFCNEFEPKED